MMNTAYYRRMHPLMVITAISLTLFSLLGIAAITGLINPARSERAESYQTAVPISAADAQKLQDEDKPKASLASKEKADNSIAESKTSRHTAQAKSGSAKQPKTLVANADSNISACSHCGQIAAINLIKQDGDASGLGAVAGGVAGGVVGNQIGKGKGNVLMTILGVGGGAYAGNTIEKKVKSTTSYLVKVHMNDGSTRTVTMADKPDFAVGDQVKVINGGLSVIS